MVKGVEGVVPRQEGVGQFGGLGGGGILCWCCSWQLQFLWLLFPNWPSAQPPKRQLRNRAKGEDGVGSLGGGELKGVQVGRSSIKFPFDNFEFS